MLFQDWQTLAVWVIIFAALAYVGRRVWERVRSFSASEDAQAVCSTGCGSCGEERSTAAATQPPGARLVQITKAASPPRIQRRV